MYHLLSIFKVGTIRGQENRKRGQENIKKTRLEKRQSFQANEVRQGLSLFGVAVGGS